MNPVILIAVSSGVIIVVIVFLFVKARIEISGLRNKFSRIIDIEAERNAIVEPNLCTKGA